MAEVEKRMETDSGAAAPDQVFRQVFGAKEISSLLMLAATIAVITAIQPRFLSFRNFEVIIDSIPEIGVMVAGVTILMISREFDLSVGSVFALAPIIFVKMLEMGGGVGPAILAMILLCAGIGAIHGLVTLKLGIPSFITTLGGMMLWRGLALVITQGFPLSFPSEGEPLRRLIVADLGFARGAFVFFLLVTLVLWVVLERTRYGNWTFATGGNEEAALALGINVARVKLVNFILVSLLAGIGGLIQALRLRAILPTAGQMYELDAIAAAVIGGAELSGGVGGIIGSTIGAFLIKMIDNGLVLIGVPGYWFRVFIALVLVVAVVFNTAVKRRVELLR